MSVPKIRILISETHNPWFNLATEEWIFRELDPSTQTLFLWRNEETVVIGRNQNPWSECALAKMEEDRVHLARRTSGGGAVFHDLGNTNFTFLSPKNGYDRHANLKIVMSALAEFGLSAEASGRNDIVIPMADGPRKISGSAFRETRDRAFHHGTLLLGADLSRLAQYLTPHPKKLESKGRTSVRARVMNVSELAPGVDHEAFSKAMIRAFCDHHGAEAAPEILDPAHLESKPALKETYERFSSWDWRFGHAPQFRHQMAEYLSWGFVEIHVDADRGCIEKVKVFSDALYPDLIDSLEASLVSKSHTRDGMKLAIAETLGKHPDKKTELDELGAWLESQVEI